MPLTEVTKLLAIFQNNFRNTKVSDDKFANITACNTIAQINFFVLFSRTIGQFVFFRSIKISKI